MNYVIKNIHSENKPCFKKSLGETLRTMRLSKNLTVKEATRRIGMSRTRLHQLERGLTELPSFNCLLNILELYGLKIDLKFYKGD